MTNFRLIELTLLALLYCINVLATPEHTRDSRIKTFIYSENDIYRIVLYNGFQSTIEFGLGEKPETISLGDNFAWQVTPIDRRIFIKPTEDNIHTNLTVITNYRTYHFELLAKQPEDEVDYNFAYVVRFFYPTDN